jgi:hypothetical protein
MTAVAATTTSLVPANTGRPAKRAKTAEMPAAPETKGLQPAASHFNMGGFRERMSRLCKWVFEKLYVKDYIAFVPRKARRTGVKHIKPPGYQPTDVDALTQNLLAYLSRLTDNATVSQSLVAVVLMETLVRTKYDHSRLFPHTSIARLREHGAQLEHHSEAFKSLGFTSYKTEKKRFDRVTQELAAGQQLAQRKMATKALTHGR